MQKLTNNRYFRAGGICFIIYLAFFHSDNKNPKPEIVNKEKISKGFSDFQERLSFIGDNIKKAKEYQENNKSNINQNSNNQISNIDNQKQLENQSKDRVNSNINQDIVSNNAQQQQNNIDSNNYKIPTTLISNRSIINGIKLKIIELSNDEKPAIKIKSQCSDEILVVETVLINNNPSNPQISSYLIGSNKYPIMEKILTDLAENTIIEGEIDKNLVISSKIFDSNINKMLNTAGNNNIIKFNIIISKISKNKVKNLCK